ncbi:MAG TPA: DUF6511 domain-containing protein [Xanthobacteraceae bacterium]|nr:DUF6511 domain-containing protein [Xanthobacteraceae bacterium]
MATALCETAKERRRLWHPRHELCAVCRSPARGLGWREPWRTRPPRPDRWFCAMSCQAFWSAQARRLAVVDLTEEERMAMLAAVKRVAEVMEEIGWERRLADLTEPQVLALIEVAVGGFQDAMREIAARNPEIPF